MVSEVKQSNILFQQIVDNLWVVYEQFSAYFKDFLNNLGQDLYIMDNSMWVQSLLFP